MRRMFSQKQIEKMVNEITDAKITAYEGFLYCSGGELDFIENIWDALLGTGISGGDVDSWANKLLGFGDYGDPLPVDIFGSFTHSFNELDETLKEIVEDAIADGSTNGVACTQAQWNVIKALLDKSLFIICQGYTMIKTCNNGINSYIFGGSLESHWGGKLYIGYDNAESLLFAVLDEI